MPVSSLLSTVVSGLRDNALRAQTAANNIVNQNTPGFERQDARSVSLVNAAPNDDGAGVQTQILAQDTPVDVARELTTLIAAEAAYKANAQVLRETEDLADTLVDIVG